MGVSLLTAAVGFTAGCSSKSDDTPAKSAVVGTGGATGDSGTPPKGDGGASDSGTKPKTDSGMPECPLTGSTPNIGVHLDAPQAVDAALHDTQSEELSGVVLAATKVREPCSLFWTPSTTPCEADAVRLDIAQGDGGTRALTIASVSADAWKTALTASVGKPVTLVLRRARGFQWNVSVGFVLRDAEGVLMAGEFGPFVPTLGAGDLPELSFRAGEAVCVLHSTCGEFEATALVFHGDTDAEVAPGTEGEFVLKSRHYAARTLGAGRWTTVTCTDLEVTNTWAIWRKDP